MLVGENYDSYNLHGHNNINIMGVSPTCEQQACHNLVIWKMFVFIYYSILITILKRSSSPFYINEIHDHQCQTSTQINAGIPAYI